LEFFLEAIEIGEKCCLIASMFDVLAIAKYIGVSSLTGATSASIAVFISIAVLMLKSKNDLISDLSLLSLVSLIWSYHGQYDYFVLIIPLAYALKNWQQGMAGLADVLIALSTCLIWFVQRIVDGAVLWFPENVLIVLAMRVVFWVSGLTIYATLVRHLIGACSTITARASTAKQR
jgi:hypothetical protein